MKNVKVKKATATILFLVCIGCIILAFGGSITAIIIGLVAAGLACSIAEDIDNLAKEKRYENGLERH